MNCVCESTELGISLGVIASITTCCGIEGVVCEVCRSSKSQYSSSLVRSWTVFIVLCLFTSESDVGSGFTLELTGIGL